MRDRRESGQAIAEFAIVFPVMLMLVLGIVQVSLMFVAKQVVDYAAYAAARAELVEEDPQQAAALVCSAIAGPTYPDGVVRNPIHVPGWGALPRSAPAVLKTEVDVLNPIGDRDGWVEVEVTHYYELVVPVASLIFRPVGRKVRPGDVPQGIFVTRYGAPHMVLKSKYKRAVPWDRELQGAEGHPVIPDLDL
ncbi:MAG: TadE family protein [Planctomycetota bacterium]